MPDMLPVNDPAPHHENVALAFGHGQVDRRWRHHATAGGRSDADAGFIALQPDLAHPMSESNAICVTTALPDTESQDMHEPETVLRMGTAACVVTVTAACKDGKVAHASINTPASFVQGLDIDGETGRFGCVRVDVPTHTGWRISSLERSAPLPAKCRWKGGQDDHPFKTEPPAASHSPGGS